MSDGAVPIKIDGDMLAAAFPNRHVSAATAAGAAVARGVDQRYWSGQFSVRVEGETVLIPERLHFASGMPVMSKGDEAWLFTRALRTRSTNGYERQLALGDLLQQPAPWAAPFIVKLIGEYVIEILEDVSAALTPELEETLGAFIVHNMLFWNRTKQRVISYWNAYYRARWLSEANRAERRDEYVGFTLVHRLEASALRHASEAG
jgi:hypothetical protein